MVDDDPGGADDQSQPGGAATWVVLGLAVVLVLGLLSVRCAFGPDVARSYPSRTLPPEPLPVLLPPPEMNDDYAPCNDCHEGEPTDPTQREFEDDHEETVLAHGDLWCLRCHDTGDRDSLRLSNGTLVEFEESWKLCTQCHGQRLDEWKAGVHGKRTGHWWGAKEVWTCVACHDPHSPKFKPIEPKPPPVPPSMVTWQPDVEPEETDREEP